MNMFLYWAGKWSIEHSPYRAGSVVIYRGHAYVVNSDTFGEPSIGARSWDWLGPFEPHRVTHPWDASPGGICRECWTEANYMYAFDGKAHQYVIQEMP